MRLSGASLQRADWTRLGTFGAVAAAAFYIGFKFGAAPLLERLIVAGGYYYILGLFAAFLVFVSRVVSRRRERVTEWLRRPGWSGVVLLAATVFVVWSDSFAHKVLFDEYVLQGTAWHMHATKEIGTPIRAYDIAGTWLAIDTFLDKRPYFFTFLVSLLHDVTGFRLENTYVLNVVLAALTLALTCWLVRALTGRTGPAFLAVGLLATLPVFGQNATGASMELHNLAMIAVVMACAVLYLRAPDADRLSCLVLGAALLAQCRYESVLFVVAAGLVIALGWLRAGRILLPWPALIAPLLLVPYVWLDRFVQSKPVLWQLRDGDTARFAWKYVTGNLEGARKFFFSLAPGQPNSFCLSVLGLAGAGWAAWRFVQWLRRPTGAARRPLSAAALVVAVFGLTVTANLAMLMFYYWSRLDELITARFALPFYFILALVTGWAVQSWEARRVPALRIGFAALACWLAVAGLHAYARRFYTNENLVMHELHWELEQVTSRPGPLLVITNKATIPYLLEHVAAVNTALARGRSAQIAWHMGQGTFREVLAVQVLRPTSAQGDVIVAPDDELPERFHLEPLARKRFGGRWIQISRVRSIEPALSATPGE